MTDIILPDRAAKNRADSAMSNDAGAAHVLAMIELLFFAYRDFTGDPDDLLSRDGLGRAHHRVLHFVYRNPGLRVADLLDILRITKQSLGRVLRQLIERGYVEQKAGQNDRRERRLYVTEQGTVFAETLSRPQRERIAAAIAALPDGGADMARDFLMQMINADERAKVLILTGKTEPEG